MPPQTPTMVTIAFNALPRATRERLVATLLRKGPVPLVAADQGDFTTFVRRIVAFAGLALACAIVFWSVGEGFGEPQHAWFRWGTGWLGVVTVMTGVLVWVALRVALALYLRVWSPVPLTTYVLPLDLVVFSGPLLQIHPLSTATGVHKTLVRGRGGYVIYDFAFPERNLRVVPQGLECVAIDRDLPEYAARHRAALARGDGAALAQLDPFFDVRHDATWRAIADREFVPAVADGPSFNARPTPRWLRFPSLVALLVAAAVGPATWALHNRLSDRAAIGRLRAHPNVTDCDAYLLTSGRHRDEVRERLLPRAALPTPGPRSLVRLREHLARYPRSELAPVVRQRIHALFEEPVAAWRAQAAHRDPALHPFMARLVAWEEAHESPPVRARFAPPSSVALAAVDASVAPAGGASEGRVIAPMAPHLAPQQLLAREWAAVTALTGSLRAVFPEAVLPLEYAGRLDEDASESDGPTFDIRYHVTTAGGPYTVEPIPLRAYAPVSFEFVITLRVPDGGPDFTYRTSAPPSGASTGRARGALSSDAEVYDAVAADAFEHLSRQLRGIFFDADAATAPPPEPEAPSVGTAPATRASDDDAPRRRHGRHHRRDD